VNSLTLSFTYIGCLSVFIDSFKVYSDSVFADDLWISRDIAFLTIPWVCHDSIFFYWFDASVVNSLTLPITYVGYHSLFINDFKVYSVSVFANDIWFRHQISFLTITFVGHEFIFAIYLMCRSWIHWLSRFHTAAITLYSLTISRSTVSLFSLTIYGSDVK
jgi:hypothetical protein